MENMSNAPKRQFYVRAVWDDEAEVYYTDSNIRGLHIEADTIEAFEEAMFDVVAEQIVTNHYSKDDLANSSFAELIPAVVWERPEPRVHA